MTNVTKRTIDYYTNLGLLPVERSASNYRYYDASVVQQVRWIEEQKANGKSLEEIRKQLSIIDGPEEIDIHEIRLQMRRLEKDVVKLMSQMDDNQKQAVKKKVSPDSAALIQSLFLLLP